MPSTPQGSAARTLVEGDAPAQSSAKPAPSRIQWVDTARGWCIVLVVAMHSALGVGLAVGDAGWLHAVVAFAKPFRMPDFFMISGLFAAGAITAPLRRFLDRRIIHFVYFYALWLLVALLVKAGALGIADPRRFLASYAWGFVEPFSSMWFIHLLPILYVATRAARRVPTAVLLGIALPMHVLAASYPSGGIYAMESVLTNWTTINGFVLFWVYFIIGVRFRDAVFRLAAAAAAKPAIALPALLAWGVVEAAAVIRGWPEIAGLDFLFGLAGACAVVVISALVARLRPMAWLASIGRRSLVVYLAFFLPMAASRTLLLRAAPWLDVGTVSVLVTAIAIAVPLAAARLLRATPLSFLFERPSWARLREHPGGGPERSEKPDSVPIRPTVAASI